MHRHFAQAFFGLVLIQIQCAIVHRRLKSAGGADQVLATIVRRGQAGPSLDGAVKRSVAGVSAQKSYLSDSQGFVAHTSKPSRGWSRCVGNGSCLTGDLSRPRQFVGGTAQSRPSDFANPKSRTSISRKGILLEHKNTCPCLSFSRCDVIGVKALRLAFQLSQNRDAMGLSR